VPKTFHQRLVRVNRSALQVLIGFVLLVGLTAALLLRVRAHYLLGQPGVKVVNVPTYSEDNNLVSRQSVFLPETVGEYTSTNMPIAKIELDMLPPDTLFGRRVYSSPDSAIMTSVVLMGTDRTSIHKPQYCLTGQGERITGSEIITIPIAKPLPYELKVMKLRTTKQFPVAGGKFATTSGIYLYWFVADGQLTPRHGERMWLMGRDLITKGLLQRWAYVAYFSRCLPGQETILFERMKRFVAASVPEFQTTTGKPEEQSAELSPKQTSLAVLAQ
jgi:hypothetical protein